MWHLISCGHRKSHGLATVWCLIIIIVKLQLQHGGSAMPWASQQEIQGGGAGWFDSKLVLEPLAVPGSRWPRKLFCASLAGNLWSLWVWQSLFQKIYQIISDPCCFLKSWAKVVLLHTKNVESQLNGYEWHCQRNVVRESAKNLWHWKLWCQYASLSGPWQKPLRILCHLV